MYLTKKPQHSQTPPPPRHAFPVHQGIPHERPENSFPIPIHDEMPLQYLMLIKRFVLYSLKTRSPVTQGAPAYNESPHSVGCFKG